MDTNRPERNNSNNSPIPELSILVVAYRMAGQLANTLHSFSPDYQQVDASRYEVIVVENESDDMLSDDVIAGLPGNFNYLRRANDSVSPVSALAAGLLQCRGDKLGVVVDGAQLATPGVVRFALMAFSWQEDCLVAVPGYHLGKKMQHEVSDGAAMLKEQSEFLSAIDWQQQGYRLFENCCFSPANQRGFLQPMMESNVFFCRKQSFLEEGVLDERFQHPGGGAINLHFWRKLGLQAGSPLVILAGEGTFHQYHGGVTTASPEHYQKRVESFNQQLQEIWQGDFHALRREPILLGQFHEAVQEYLQASVTLAQRRAARLTGSEQGLWQDDQNLESSS